jgi:hypothetical protein
MGTGCLVLEDRVLEQKSKFHWFRERVPLVQGREFHWFKGKRFHWSLVPKRSYDPVQWTMLMAEILVKGPWETRVDPEEDSLALGTRVALLSWSCPGVCSSGMLHEE